MKAALRLWDIGIIFVRGGIRYSFNCSPCDSSLCPNEIDLRTCSRYIDGRRPLWSSSILCAVLAATAISAVSTSEQRSFFKPNPPIHCKLTKKPIRSSSHQSKSSETRQSFIKPEISYLQLPPHSACPIPQRQAQAPSQ